jgi:hypothetical protein
MAGPCRCGRSLRQIETHARSRTTVGLTSVAELRAGLPRRPYRGALAAATDEASEGAKCSQRDAMPLPFRVPTNGPRVSSSAKLARPLFLPYGDAFEKKL